MTKRELAGYFGITDRTVEEWMRRRYIPYIKIGQTVRFRVATVLRYVDEKYVVPAGQRGRVRSRSTPAGKQSNLTETETHGTAASGTGVAAGS